MKRIINKLKDLSWPDKINYSFYLVMSILFIINGLFNYFSGSASVEQLLSYIMVAIGLTCFEDFLGKFHVLSDIQSDIKDIKNKDFCLEPNMISLSTRALIEREFSLTDRFSNATEVRMISYANYALFQPNYITFIEDGIKNGTNFKFVGLTPKSDRVENITKYKMLNHVHPNPMEVTLSSYNKFKTSQNYTDDQILYKVCDIDFPYGITIIYKRNGEKTVKVDLYSINTPNKSRRCMFLSSDNPSELELIEFFLNQWDIVWSIAEEYNPD